MDLARCFDLWGLRFPFLSAHGGTNPSCPGGRFRDLLQTLLGPGGNDKRGSWMEPPDAADLRGDEASSTTKTERAGLARRRLRGPEIPMVMNR